MTIHFSESDVRILRGMARDYRNRAGGTKSRPGTKRSDQDDYLTPEVYVVRPTSAGGIPAITEGTPDEAGNEICEIWSINDDDEIKESSSLTEKVYNVGNVIIPQEYTLAYRTKYGKWVARPTGNVDPIFCTMTYDWSSSTATYTKVAALSDSNDFFTVSASGLKVLEEGYYNWGITIEVSNSSTDTTVTLVTVGISGASSAIGSPNKDIKIETIYGEANPDTTRASTGILFAEEDAEITINHGNSDNDYQMGFWIHKLRAPLA